MKMKYFGLSETKFETKLFHFHGIFRANEIKSAKRTPTPLYLYIPEILDPPMLLMEPDQEMEPVWLRFRSISDKICNVGSAFN